MEGRDIVIGELQSSRIMGLWFEESSLRFEICKIMFVRRGLCPVRPI